MKIINSLFSCLITLILAIELFQKVSSNSEKKSEKNEHYFKIEKKMEEKDINDRVDLPSDNWLQQGLYLSKSDPTNNLICDLKQLNFPNPTTSFTDFFSTVKSVWGRLSSFDIKSIFKFLDSENLGYFTNKRWTNFSFLFLNSFTLCDTDNDCTLNHEELVSCFEKEDMKAVIDSLPDDITKEYLIMEIIFSLDNKNLKGLNFNDYLFLKKVIIGFRQYNVQGKIDSQSFYSAIKTSFIDKLIDQSDSDLAFRVGVSLMYDQIKFFQVNFLQYFEITRIVNAYISHDVSIGEGFITKENLMHNFEGDRFPSKISKFMFQDYFSMFEEDKNLIYNNRFQFPHTALRFEDYAVVEFYANIFKNYTDPLTYGQKLNKTGFVQLVSNNKYIRKKYHIYISYSNFEETARFNETKKNMINITDYDFLTNYRSQFLETENKILLQAENLLQNKINKYLLKSESNLKTKNSIKSKINTISKKFMKKEGSESMTSVFNQFESQSSSSEKANMQANTEFLAQSLFSINLGEEEKIEDEPKTEPVNPIVTYLKPALTNYFNIFDIGSTGFLTFSNFMTFVKFLRLWDKLNEKNVDPRGILNSNLMNVLSGTKIQPKLALSESERLQNMDYLNCNNVDFLLFVDYMLAPKVFDQFLEKKDRNYVNEINLQLGLRKLNLFTDINDKKLLYQQGNFMKNFDYENILNMALKNKCSSNLNIFNTTEEFLKQNNITNSLNSSWANSLPLNSTNINIATGSHISEKSEEIDKENSNQGEGNPSSSNGKFRFSQLEKLEGNMRKISNKIGFVKKNEYLIGFKKESKYSNNSTKKAPKIKGSYIYSSYDNIPLNSAIMNGGGMGQIL